MSDNSDSAAESKAKELEVQLYPCIPIDWMWLPKSWRMNMGSAFMTLFAVSFLSIPISLLLVFPFMWKYFPYFCTGWIAMSVVSMGWPSIEWPAFRSYGQLWYELLDFHCNLSPEKRAEMLVDCEKKQYIIGMHPHGIVPFHAILWAAYCHQYLSDRAKKKELYGFGAAADVVGYIPFLRNIMGWLSAGPADYKTLKMGLEFGISAPVNAARRQPKNLYILPGGVAEVFVSTPGKHTVVFKSRTGLCKLALETGAQLCPCYVFGGTDFFENLATNGGFLAQMSRKMRAGVTIFWGRYFLPIPYKPKVTLCIADPIPMSRWSEPGPVPKEMIEELQAKYIASIQSLFEKYKAAAGYPDAQLEIL